MRKVRRNWLKEPEDLKITKVLEDVTLGASEKLRRGSMRVTIRRSDREERSRGEMRTMIERLMFNS